MSNIFYLDENNTRVANTFFFEEVFENYQAWHDYMNENGVIDYTIPLHATFDRYCYDLLSIQYYHTNIRYSNVDDFKRQLILVYITRFDDFLKEKELVDAIFNLTLDEIATLNSAISNVSNNPNDEIEDPTKPIKFISGQTYNQVTSNKLQAYLTALNNIPHLDNFRFLKHRMFEYDMCFDDLFMQVLPNNIYVYGGEC